MSKPYISLDNMAVEAELYGLFRLLPKKDECQHVTCGWASSGYWDYKTSRRVEWFGRDKTVKCTYERYVKCTNQELSDPNQKVGTIFAAIKVAVTKKGGYSAEWVGVSMIFLYDLIGDVVEDAWFQRGGNESIAPHSGAGQDWPKPSTLKNLAEVIEGMKKAI